MEAKNASNSKICFEDFEVGTVRTFGPRLVTREEIIEFATEFDPQPMHLDEEAANKSMLKGLSASGWHTSAIMMRMVFDGLLQHAYSLGGPGVEEMRWVKPLRPGDQITARMTCLEKRESNSRPNMGFVRHSMEITNQNGEVVLQATWPGMFGKRNPGTPA
ncbi:MAG: MaoC family dehydratase [Xanthobacteraceae bacterium]|nr:MaoC family dehydratase [Xanthobacteraceae bacterium]QYK44441.1 MAG: MaoC family dehydratase [Xanthobacteraceae bacterium]HMN51100.1 MaoC family dehydratase [Xanthobacteraceae bacterium]